MKELLITAILLYSNFSFSSIELNSVGVFVKESDREAVIYVTNVSNNEVLVYAKEDHDETIAISGKSLFYVSPPVSKLAPYEKQLIRVILKEKNLKSQKLARILIQEIPYIENPDSNTLSFVKSYNIPALAHPTNLVEDYFPWKKAVLENKEKKSFIVNDSLYLIKIMPTIKCKNHDHEIFINIDSPYIMPKNKIALNEKCNHIIVHPVSNEGKILEKYIIKHKT